MRGRGVTVWLAVLLAGSMCCGPSPRGTRGPPDDSPSPSTEGWITIDDAGGLATRCPSLLVQGRAILSAAGEVSVSWQNLTTGDAGAADTSTGSDHVSWSATVPVAPGANEIRVVRLDPVGIPAEDSTLAQRLPGVLISGLVTSQDGMPLRGVGVNALGPLDETSYTGTDGRYALCLSDGEYSLTVTPSCPLDPPAPRSVTVSGTDVAVPDFVWSHPYFEIFGVVWPAMQAMVEASPTAGFEASLVTRTSALGSYGICVPPGTWHVRVVGEPWQRFYPPTTTLDVVNGDEELWFFLDTSPL